LVTLCTAADSAKEVLAAQEAFGKASVAGDKAALDKLLHDDLQYVHSSGQLDSKSVYIGNITSGRSKYLAMEMSGTTVRVFGNYASVRTKLVVRGEQQGKEMITHLNVLFAWVKAGKGWQMVDRQAIRVQP